MIVLEGLNAIRRALRNIGLVLLACGSCVLLGHFLRELNIVLNPLAWTSAEIISALLSLTIAANVLVRYHGTGNRVSLLLGLTFAVTGIVHLGGIFEFYHSLDHADQFHVPVSWMAGQSLLGLFLFLAYTIDKYVPWPRETRRNIAAVSAMIVSASCLIASLFLIFPNISLIHPGSHVPREWELLPVALFVGAAVVLNRMKNRDRFAFDAVLVWVAGLNAASGLIASQSVRLLDAPAAGAELIQTVSYIVLLGATLLDNAQLFGQVRTLAISDSLTGLANYRRLVDILQTELERSGRTGRPFSLLLMDLDGLKLINDRHGHITGSRALCRVAEILRLNCRSVDTAARYGGDEFALVLPETSEPSARQVAARIREYLDADTEVPRLSLSVGIATFPHCGATVQQLIESADLALYEMKGKSKSHKMEKRGST
jgi:diguanylate cyclase (GGDEF)-like protein